MNVLYVRQELQKTTLFLSMAEERKLRILASANLTLVYPNALQANALKPLPEDHNIMMEGTSLSTTLVGTGRLSCPAGSASFLLCLVFSSVRSLLGMPLANKT